MENDKHPSGDPNVLSASNDENPSITSTRKRQHNIACQTNPNKDMILTKNKPVRVRATKLRKRAKLLNKRWLFKQRVHDAKVYMALNLIEKMSGSQCTFPVSGIKYKKSRKKHFTVNDKILALQLYEDNKDLYKGNKTAYPFLAKMFTLPSKTSLLTLIKNGINPIIFQILKQKVAKLKPLQKYCVLMFGEMPVAQEKNLLIFMIRGIDKKFEQLVAFFFGKSSTESAELKNLIKKVILELQNAGLNVVATISNQRPTNCEAINMLEQDTIDKYARNKKKYDKLGYEVGGVGILHIFNVPHLLKGVRNNLLKKDLIYEEDGVKKTAKWDHIIKFYENQKEGNVNICYKLTDAHIYADKINKMKVSVAAQVLSQRVGAYMAFTARFSPNEIDRSPVETAHFVVLINQLFDSCNGHFLYPRDNNMLRCVVKRKSRHEFFWRKAIKTLESVRYVDPETNKLKSIPSILNWVKTLNAFLYLKYKLLNSGFKFINLRNFNQDPIEKFFGTIQSRDQNESPSRFSASIKTFLLNKCLAMNSIDPDDTKEKEKVFRAYLLRNSNCEDDEEVPEVFLDDLMTY